MAISWGFTSSTHCCKYNIRPSPATVKKAVLGARCCAGVGPIAILT